MSNYGSKFDTTKSEKAKGIYAQIPVVGDNLSSIIDLSNLIFMNTTHLLPITIL